MKQKFKRGDIVKVADDLGMTMRHFRGAGEEAMVVASYADQYQGGRYHKDDNIEYTLKFKKHGEISWYHEHQLTLLKSGPKDIVASYK